MIDQELIDRVRSGKGEDPALEWDIAEAFGEIPKHEVRKTGWDFEWWRRPKEYRLWKANDVEGRSVTSWTPKKRLTDLNAVLALIAEKLPGWAWKLEYSPRPESWGFVWTVGSGYGWSAISPCRALLAAALSALLALNAKDDADADR